ncbi:hypothetical protein BEH_07690 [Priestia filamentosa]|uniref:Uncharacterized protein n=1 Tax=Priestia filamentosa TaxID=1402861 RepID=A0A0H4KCZ6_9BACI|nr:hypothetical protein [Priestia filamentosa]AKO91992.1 hypothetical protein BEH_07690 [Priestia filamentosa]
MRTDNKALLALADKLIGIMEDCNDENTFKRLNDLIEESLKQVEDAVLADTYGDVLIASETGKTKMYEVQSTEEIFKLVNKLEEC